MKRFIAGLVLGIVLSLSVTGLASYQEISIFVNGNKIETDVPPQIIEGRTMVPIRFVAEAFGAEVKWDEDNRDVIIQTVPLVEQQPIVEQQPETVKLGDTISKDGLVITLHRIRYNEDGFTPDDPGSTPIYSKGFGIYFTVANNTNNVYQKPRMSYEVKPTLYEAEVNRIGYTHYPVGKSFYIYPGETISGSYQYMIDKDINIEQVTVTISKIDQTRHEPYGIWLIK